MTLLANIVLLGVAVVALTDLFALRLRSQAALRFRWSIPWYMLRYSTIIAAIALALRVAHP